MMRKQTAQSTIEFALFVLVVVAGLLAMSVYIKRAMQGNIRGTSGSLGEQYDPQHTTSDITVTRSGSSTTFSDQIQEDGMVISTSYTAIDSDRTGREGYEQIEAMGGLWD